MPLTLGMLTSKKIAQAAISVVSTDHGGSGTDSANYSFANRPIGVADATRILCVGVCSRSGGAAGTATVYVDGVLMARRVGLSSGNNRIELHTLAVPVGSTATIQVVWSGGVARMGFAVWALYGVLVVPKLTATSAANPGSCSLNIGANEIGLAYSYTSATTATTWSGTAGAVENFDANEVEGQGHSGASILRTSPVTPGTMIATRGSSVDEVMAAAVFGAT